jgi:hypothetical protein
MIMRKAVLGLLLVTNPTFAAAPAKDVSVVCHIEPSPFGLQSRPVDRTFTIAPTGIRGYPEDVLVTADQAEGTRVRDDGTKDFVVINRQTGDLLESVTTPRGGKYIDQGVCKKVEGF